MAQDKIPLQELISDDEGILPFESRLRHNILKMPKEIQKASGIVVFGRRIKSLLFQHCCGHRRFFFAAFAAI